MKSTIKRIPAKLLGKILILLALLPQLFTPVAAKTPLSPYLPMVVKSDSKVLPVVNETETLNTGQLQLNFFFPAGYEPAYAHNAAPALATALTYASYVGGGGVDEGKGVAVDGLGNIYVLGKTGSNNFLGSGHTPSGYSDIFVAKFNPTGGSLLYLSFIGSRDSETPLSIQVDGQGNVYATAMVFDANFPTKNALWPQPPLYWQDSVLFKLDGNGAVVYSTYLPLDVFGARHNLAVDAAGNAYVTGSSIQNHEAEGWVSLQLALLKLNPSGSQLLLEKYVGGVDKETGIALVLDPVGNIYLTGTTEGGDSFPVTANSHQPVCGDIFYQHLTYCFEDGVVVVLNPAGEVTYSSYHGGSFTDEPQAIATDGQGNILIAGNTTSSEFPLKQALQTTCPINPNTENCLSPRGFVSLIHLGGGAASLTYSTYLGAAESDSNNVVMAAAMDGNGQATVTGYTSGLTFPMVAPIQGQLSESFCTTFGYERYCFDAFVTTFTPSGELAFSTYLGATFDEFPYDVTLTGNGGIYLTGMTEANNFPVTSNAFQPNNQVGDDAFLVRIGSGGSGAPGNNKIFLPLVIR